MFSIAIVGLLFIAFLLILPGRAIRWPVINAVVPMSEAIMFRGELSTATRLYHVAAVFRSRALTVLATGYVVATALIVPLSRAFLGAFTADRLLGAINNI